MGSVPRETSVEHLDHQNPTLVEGTTFDRLRNVPNFGGRPNVLWEEPSEPRAAAFQSHRAILELRRGQRTTPRTLWHLAHAMSLSSS